MTVSNGNLAIPISIILIRRRELFPAFFKYEIQDWSSRRETGKRKPQQPFYNLVNDGICLTGLMTRRISFSGRGVVWSSMIVYLYLCILFSIQAKAYLLVLTRANRKCEQLVLYPMSRISPICLYLIWIELVLEKVLS